mgnify:CR=1 FL=1
MIGIWSARTIPGSDFLIYGLCAGRFCFCDGLERIDIQRYSAIDRMRKLGERDQEQQFNHNDQVD